MNTAARYAFFCARLPVQTTPDRPMLHSIFPPSFGGTPGRANRVAVCAREALHAYGMLWKLAPNNRVRRSLALYLRRALNAPGMAHLGGRKAWLLRAIAPFTRGEYSPRTAPISVTLYHENGSSVTGNFPALAQATGLDPRRVRDLVSGRRAFSEGWATTPEAAAGNRRKRGRPPVEKDFWMSL